MLKPKRNWELLCREFDEEWASVGETYNYQDAVEWMDHSYAEFQRRVREKDYPPDEVPTYCIRSIHRGPFRRLEYSDSLKAMSVVDKSLP